jgi:hypothetical protein
VIETSLAVLLVYAPQGGKPVTVARVSRRNVVVQVAEAAIAEAQVRAELFRETDEVLGGVEREEVIRLERVLKMFVPELSTDATPRSRHRTDFEPSECG